MIAVSKLFSEVKFVFVVSNIVLCSHVVLAAHLICFVPIASWRYNIIHSLVKHVGVQFVSHDAQHERLQHNDRP